MCIIKANSETVSKLRIRDFCFKTETSQGRWTLSKNRTWPSTDGWQILDYPERRGSQTRPEWRAFSFPHRVANLQDGAQWSLPPGIYTLIESPSTLYPLCVWLVAYSISDDMSFMRSDCRRLQLLSWASLLCLSSFCLLDHLLKRQPYLGQFYEETHMEKNWYLLPKATWVGLEVDA